MKNNQFLIFFVLFLFVAVSATKLGRNYESIINFGDSLSDTGNIIIEKPNTFPGQSPYGSTFFNNATGRSSDGRLVIDFIAEANGLPYLPPYLSLGKDNKLNITKIKQGVNFAVAGATALDAEFFHGNTYTNSSLNVQIEWFKKIKPSLCSTQRECQKYFEKTLFFVGEIGGNDINYILLSGQKQQAIEKTVIPGVIQTIINATATLIKEGAKTLVVPGNLPIGCESEYLARSANGNDSMLDGNGCLKDRNQLAERFNSKLNEGLETLRHEYPGSKIIYADYYGAALQIFKDPLKFGFQKEFWKACCSGGGMLKCGPDSRKCDDPSKYVSWDGIHLTEAAYRNIASALLDTFTHPTGFLNASSYA